MNNYFESFRLFLESDRKAFLLSQLANPEDDVNFLVFADWLDENDDPGLARILRQVVQGHSLKDHGSWSKSIQDDLMNLYQKSNVFDTDYANMTFQMHGDKKHYRLTPKGIESGIKSFKPVPQKDWTDQLVSAATFVLIQHYLQLPVQMGRDERIETSRTTGMKNRVFESLTNQIGQLMNQTSIEMIRLAWHVTTETRRNVRNTFKYLYGLVQRWMDMTEGKDLKKEYPGICEKANRVHQMILDLERSINSNYPYLATAVNWVNDPHDLITPEIRAMQARIESICP